MIEIQAFRLNKSALKIQPGKKQRDWLPTHAYKCLPVTIENQFGYDIVSTEPIEVDWNGEPTKEALTVTGCGAVSKFGGGTFTLDLGVLFKTSRGIGTRIGPCPNDFPYIEPQFSAMSAFVETDKLDYPWFLTLRVHRKGPVCIPAGTILARIQFLPLPVNSRIIFEPEPAEVKKARSEYYKLRKADKNQGKTRFYADLPIRKNLVQSVEQDLDSKIVVIDDFLTQEQCLFLQSHAMTEERSEHEEDDQFWSGRIWWPEITPPDLKKRLSTVRGIIDGEFHTRCQPPENWQVVKWPEGIKMPMHRDYGKDHEYPHREFAAIIYLNDDYEGGETLFRNGEAIKPKAGRLVIFRGGPRPHGVSKVSNGTRYTSITWFPEDKS